MIDIEKLASSIMKKTVELKKEVFPEHKDDFTKTDFPNNKQESINNYEREDGLSNVIASRLESITLNERVEKGLEERKSSIQNKLEKELEEIRQINEESLKEMNKK